MYEYGGHVCVLYTSDGYCSMCLLPSRYSLLGQHYYQMTRVLDFDVYHISFLMLIIVALRGIESHMLLERYKGLYNQERIRMGG